MMFIKSFKLFESSNSIDEKLGEIISNEGWMARSSSNEEILYSYKYKLTEKANIGLTVFNDSNNIWIDMFNESYDYSVGLGEYYSLRVIDGLSIKNNNYDQMMNICNFLCNYFEEQPSDDIVSQVEMAFIDISDIAETIAIEWGYISEVDYGIGFESACFPAKNVKDKLGLALDWKYDCDFNFIKEEFEYNKDKLKSIFISSNVKLLNIDSNYYKYSVIIKTDIEY